MKRTIIIAEAGVNHNGNVALAKQLIDVAALAGVDYVKFQTFIAEKNISKKAIKADYQQENTNNLAESQLEMVKKLELSFNDFVILKEYCDSKEVKFLSTGFDIESLIFLKSIGMEIAKIPSGEITNLPYLRKVASLFNNIILSTGMCTIDEVRDAMNVFQAAGIPEKSISILHCNTEYPTPMVDVNLRVMNALMKEFGTSIGYSDHTLGIEVPIAAVAMGAQIIEKHFTLDKQMEGPDHKASLDPLELKEMVKAIRNIENALGSEVKMPSPSETKNIAIARKSIHIAFDLEKDSVLTYDNLISKRPGDGISPMHIDEVVGKKIKLALPQDHKLSFADFE